MLLDTIKGQRNTVGRTAKKIVGLAAEISRAMPELAQDLTLAGLFLDQAEEKLLTAETRIEDLAGQVLAREAGGPPTTTCRADRLGLHRAGSMETALTRLREEADDATSNHLAGSRRPERCRGPYRAGPKVASKRRGKRDSLPCPLPILPRLRFPQLLSVGGV